MSMQPIYLLINVLLPPDNNILHYAFYYLFYHFFHTIPRQQTKKQPFYFSFNYEMKHRALLHMERHKITEKQQQQHNKALRV